MEINKVKSVINNTKSFRQAAKILGVNHPMLIRYVKNHDISYNHFLFGKTYEKMIGLKFNMLTILSIIKDNIKNRIFANCVCDCGKKKRIRADLIKNETYISCGCHSKNRKSMTGNLNPSFKGVGKIGISFFNELKRTAKRRNLDFNITIDYLWKIFKNQNGKCSLTNQPLKFGRIRRHNETTASLDRIDNNLGYIVGNVRWVLKDINMIRKNYDTEYFIELCNLVAKHNPRAVKDQT